MAGPPLGRDPGLDRGDQRDRARRGRDRPAVPARARSARVHPGPGDQRDPRARSVRRWRSAPGPRRSAATSTATRPPGGPSTPARSPAPGCARRGTGGRGPRPDPTRSSPPTAPSWWPGGTTSCASSATATRPRPVAAGGDAAGVDRPRRRRRPGRLHARGEAVGVEHRRHPRQDRGPPRPDLPGRRPGRPGRAGRGHHRPRRRPVHPAAHLDRCARARPVAHLAAGARGRGRPDRPARPPRRAARPPVRVGGRGLVRVDPTQAAVVGVLAGDGPLVVVEGAAGAGKTTALAHHPASCWPDGATGWWW